MKIFLDLDGVLADFLTIAELHYDEEATPGVHGFHHQLGLEWPAFMNGLESHQFWLNLPELPFAEEIVQMVLGRIDETDLYFLSAPGFVANCAHQKLAWVKSFLCEISIDIKTQLICTSYKDLFARNDRLLIDDNEENCARWEMEGGQAFLYPQRTNSLHCYTNNPIPLLSQALDRLLPN